MRQVKEFIDRDDETSLSWKQHNMTQDKKWEDDNKSKAKVPNQVMNVEEQMKKTVLGNQLKVVFLVRDPRGIFS